MLSLAGIHMALHQGLLQGASMTLVILNKVGMYVCWVFIVRKDRGRYLGRAIQFENYQRSQPRLLVPIYLSTGVILQELN